MTLFLIACAVGMGLYLKGRRDGAEAARTTMRASLERKYGR
jgi:hypothetical protein